MSALPSLVCAFGDAAVWRADELARPAGRVLATGHGLLDLQLPGGGWPVGAMVEILQAQSGQNEWRLLLPALRTSPAGPVVLVGAPHVPFGPGLAAQGWPGCPRFGLTNCGGCKWLRPSTASCCLSCVQPKRRPKPRPPCCVCCWRHPPLRRVSRRMPCVSTSSSDAAHPSTSPWCCPPAPAGWGHY